jgi:ketosteroid isomerase-like protein
MSQENVEIVRRMLEAGVQERVKGVLGYLDVEIEWTTTDAYLEQATYRGHEGVRSYLEALSDEFDDFRVEPVELIDAGEHVIACVRTTGRGKVSGAPVYLTLTAVCLVRSGKIIRIRNYPEKTEALEAVGLRE